MLKTEVAKIICNLFKSIPMKNLFLFILFTILFLHYSFCYSQTKSKLNFDFNDNECYIIARGTKSKQGFISKQFNIINDSITHIGIGIKYKNEFKIFNVNAVKNVNALTIESFESFTNQADLTYLGIWKLVVNDNQRSFLKKHLPQIAEKYIEFDYDFLIGNSENNLYCSEFIWLITNELGADFKFDLKKIYTANLGLNDILKREVLEYIPPDYFLAFSKIKFITSWHNKNL